MELRPGIFEGLRRFESSHRRQSGVRLLSSRKSTPESLLALQRRQTPLQ
ncbi:hypothetical protein L3Y34_009068 [Caenorhabditis briggsae]|uniref:Uncharacterized protein n=1 Tax=Caenorhabditis briggsae TaxID=6238 RepID=A0AAE9A6F4_CAEBR|nr:hypothetical protein L3Y34_009068 [Caenorhabditis briggsae]